MTEVVGGLQFTRLNSVPVPRESDVFLEPIHLPESELFDVGKGAGDQNKQETHKGESMAILLAILDFLFGCRHVHLSRVFTLQG